MVYARRGKAGFIRLKSDYPNYRRSVTGAGIWLSCDKGWHSFQPHSFLSLGICRKFDAYTLGEGRKIPFRAVALAEAWTARLAHRTCGASST